MKKGYITRGGNKNLDTLSHGLWGYAILRHRGTKMARMGFLFGMAPDLIYSGLTVIYAMFTQGWEGYVEFFNVPKQAWKKNGPPLPDLLVFAYEHFYVLTHSLVLCSVVGLIWYAITKRKPYLLLPWVFHIVLDIPTHERYLTPFLYPISPYTFEGISWGTWYIFFPNVLLLALTLFYLRRKYKRAAPLEIGR